MAKRPSNWDRLIELLDGAGDEVWIFTVNCKCGASATASGPIGSYRDAVIEASHELAKAGWKVKRKTAVCPECSKPSGNAP
jgi:hypothetical protein